MKIITTTQNIAPHNPFLEIKLLQLLSHPSIITLSTTTKDCEGRLVLVFPYQPMTLSALLSSASPIPEKSTSTIFHNIFSALHYLHQRDIIHRDIKPSNILLSSPTGPALLADFGTAFHPTLSPLFSSTPSPTHPSQEIPETQDQKVLEVGTTHYRAPETLFGQRSYTTNLDLWSTGVMLAECLLHSSEATTPQPLFESRGTEEDGNQLSLIHSQFRTLGTPTPQDWPSAVSFTTPPFEWYRVFPGRPWVKLLPGVDERGRDLVAGLVRWEGGWRITAEEVCGGFLLPSFPFRLVRTNTCVY